MNTVTGAVAQQLTYDEFGIVTLDTNPQFQTFGYAGGLYDSSTGLLRFGAREYDAESGRWLQKDPIRFQGGDTNLYGYVGQDPINFVDPEGTNPLLVAGAIAATGVVVGTINAIATYRQPGATLSDAAQSFGVGFITGAAAITAGVLTGGVPAAGALGIAVTGTGAAVGVATDVGLTLLLAPYTVPLNELDNGVKAVNNNSCRKK